MVATKQIDDLSRNLAKAFATGSTEALNFKNILPLEEIFTGSNYKSYKHKYFLAYIDLEEEPINKFQDLLVKLLE